MRALDKQREKKTNNKMKGAFFLSLFLRIHGVIKHSSSGFLGRDKSGKGIGLETDKDYHKPAPGTIASGDDS